MSHLQPVSTSLLSSLMSIKPFLMPYWRHAIAALIALGVAAGATLSLPVAFRYLIDFGFADNKGQNIDQYFIALFALATVLALATALRFYFVSWLGERVTADIRSAVYSHIVKMSPQFFESLQTGEVLSRLTTDTTLIQTLVGTSLSMGLRNLFILVGGVLMLTYTNAHLAGYISFTLVLVVIPIVFFGRQVRKLSRTSQDKIADTSAMAGEVLNAIPTIQSFTQELRESTRFTGAVEIAFNSALTRIRARSYLTVTVILLIFGAVTFVLWLGANAVMAGTMTAGELSQFILYAVVTAGAIGGISEVWGDVQRAAGAMERLTQLLMVNSPVVESNEPVSLPNVPVNIHFDKVNFSYPSRPKSPVLTDFSLSINEGEYIAVVGPSGAGKTTLFQMLLRFYDPQSGNIIFNGINLKDLTLNDARKHLSVVLQDTVIFATSVFENIRYGRPTATLEEVQQAAIVAAADQFIKELPEGYDTFLGERGVRLSGGQRQRISIARAILSNPLVLLLDEATSALDAESERAVQNALDNAAKNRTTLVIAHRLATVKKANRIIVMDAGKIVAEGTHEQLLKNSPLYARLATLQFSN